MTRVRAVLLLIVLLLVVVVRLAHHDEGQAAPAASPVAPSASPAATASPSPSPSPSGSPSLAPSAQGAVHAAQVWVAAWLNTSGGQALWLARLQPLTDGALWDNLALPGVVDAVPRGTVRPGARAVGDDQGSTAVTVPTTAGAMLVVMTPRGGGWVAISNDRAPR